MSKSQITEGIVVRIEHELAALVQEIAEICVPARRGMTELRLRRSLSFGRPSDFIWIDIREEPDRLGQCFRMEVRDMTFEPGYVYTLQKIWAPHEIRGGGAGEVLSIVRFLSEISADLLREIRADLEPPDESA